MKRNPLDYLEPKAADLVKTIGKLAHEQGMRAYLVGGPVRDLLLKISNVDLDIAVEGDGMRLAQRFAEGHPGWTVTRYPAFKTATVRRTDGSLVDFATARKERYARGGAFPEVTAAGLKEDLFRRDFTINAMALSLDPAQWGKLIDPHGGLEDLKRKRLRVLHEQSFVDDPTRILRAARFKARLRFKMEAETLKLLKGAVRMKVLETIKPQRYLKDFNKILKEPCAQEAVRCLKAWDAYRPNGGPKAVPLRRV